MQIVCWSEGPAHASAGLYTNFVVPILDHTQVLVENSQNCTKLPIDPLILTFGRGLFMLYCSFGTHDRGGTIENSCCVLKAGFMGVSVTPTQGGILFSLCCSIFSLQKISPENA